MAALPRRVNDWKSLNCHFWQQAVYFFGRLAENIKNRINERFIFSARQVNFACVQSSGTVKASWKRFNWQTLWHEMIKQKLLKKKGFVLALHMHSYARCCMALPLPLVTTLRIKIQWLSALVRNSNESAFYWKNWVSLHYSSKHSKLDLLRKMIHFLFHL